MSDRPWDVRARVHTALDRHRIPAMALSVALLLLGAVWTVSAFTSVTRHEEVVRTDEWAEEAGFTYEVPVTRASAIYPNGTRLGMEEGGYFTALSPQVELAFEWRFKEPSQVPVHGAASLTVRTDWRSSHSGANWSLVEELDRATLAGLAGSQVRLEGVLDIPALLKEAADTNAALGVGDGSLSWTVQATVGFAASTPFGEVRNLSVFQLPIQAGSSVYTLPGAAELAYDRAYAEERVVVREQRGGMAAVQASMWAPAASLAGLAGLVAMVRHRPRGGDEDGLPAGLVEELRQFEDWVTRVHGPMELPPERVPCLDLDRLEDLVAMAAEARTRVLLDLATATCYVVTPQACFRLVPDREEAEGWTGEEAEGWTGEEAEGWAEEAGEEAEDWQAGEGNDAGEWDDEEKARDLPTRMAALAGPLQVLLGRGRGRALDDHVDDDAWDGDDGEEADPEHDA